MRELSSIDRQIIDRIIQASEAHDLQGLQVARLLRNELSVFAVEWDINPFKISIYAPRKEKKPDFERIMANYFDVASHSHPPVCSICVCIERALLQKIGGFPMGITSGEDLLTWARVAIQTHWAYSLNACAIYNMGEGYDKKNLPPRRQDVGDPVGKQLMELYSANPDVIGLRS